MSAYAVEAEGLLKRYGAVTALRDVSFRVTPGTITGFVGRNGAGKTTSLKIVSTLLKADDGTCRVGGADVRRDRWAVRRMTGFLPDVFDLPSVLTLREYLGIMAELYGVPAGDRARRVETTVQLTRTDDFANRRLNALSRGEQQRVGLARALIHNPDILVLDEPASGLDPHARVEFKDLLRLLRERGKTMLLSSHVLADLEEICDELVVIRRGTVMFCGDMPGFRKQMQSVARWRLVTTGAQPSVPSGVAVEVLDAGPNWIDVQGDLSAADRARWVAELVRHGIGVSEVSPQQSTLEQEFAKAVEEEENGA